MSVRKSANTYIRKVLGGSSGSPGECPFHGGLVLSAIPVGLAGDAATRLGYFSVTFGCECFIEWQRGGAGGNLMYVHVENAYDAYDDEDEPLGLIV